MTNLIAESIVANLTHTTELYFHSSNTTGKVDGWEQADTLQFMRKVTLERMINHFEFWLPKQEEREAKALYFYERYKREFNQTEIAENNLRGAIARLKSERMNVAIVREELLALRCLYAKEFDYNPDKFEGAPKAEGEMPDDLKSLMAEVDSL